MTTDLRARIDEHLRGSGLPQMPEAVEKLAAYFALLTKWNARMNLTALTLEGAPEPTLDRLFVEPLDAARFISAAPLRWFDFGSGGGSPAIPGKIIRPAALLTMVESKGRKAAFLREAVRNLGLTGTTVESDRFESIADRPALQGRVDLITVRAVSPDEALFVSASKLLRSGGSLLLFGSGGEEPAVPATTAVRSAFQLVSTEQLRTSSPSAISVLRRT